jgi:hypothetical protein
MERGGGAYTTQSRACALPLLSLAPRASQEDIEQRSIDGIRPWHGGTLGTARTPAPANPVPMPCPAEPSSPQSAHLRAVPRLCVRASQTRRQRAPLRCVELIAMSRVDSPPAGCASTRPYRREPAPQES